MRVCLALLPLVTMLIAPPAARADQTTGTLRLTSAQSPSETTRVVVTAPDSGREWVARAEGDRAALVTGLPPDRYHLAVTLANGQTARLDLEIGAAETVCLEARGGLRITDRYRAALGTYLDRRQLGQMPAGSGLAAILDTAAPFVTGDRLDTGGLGLGLMARVSGEAASWIHSSIGVAGFESPRAPGSGDQRVLAPNLLAAQAVAVAPEMAPADVGSPGIAAVWIPRRPGSSRHGAIAGEFTSSAMVSANRTPTAPSIERLDSWKSGSAEFGGPVTPRVGVFATVFAAAMRKHERDRPAPVDARMASAFAHIVSNPDRRTQLRLIGSVDDVRRPYGEMAPFRAAGIDEHDRMFRLYGIWERQRDNGSRLEAAAGYDRGTFDPSGSLTDGAVVDRAIDGLVPPPTSRVAIDRIESRILLALPEVRRHALEFGLTLARSAAGAQPGPTSTIAELVYGLPARIWTPAEPAADSSRRAYHVAGYVADRWKAGPGLTLNLGLRAGVSSGRAEGSGRSVTWPALLPRASARWGMRFGTLFGGYARYQADLPLDVLAFGDPGEAELDVYRWTDANANRRLDAGERGTLVARAGRGPGVASIDPSLRAPHTDETVIGAERPWGSRMTIRITQVWRRERSILRSVNAGAPASSYQAIVIPDRGEDHDGATDDRPLTIYDRRPSSFGLDRFVLMNTDDVTEYNSTEIAWELRGQTWWSIVGASSYDTWGLGGNTGFRVDERDQGILGQLRENPNAASYSRGAVFFDRQYVLKWSTGYHGWRDLRIATVARYQDGQAFSRIIVAPDLAQGPELVNTYRAGRTRFTFTATLDARIEKGFAVGKRRASVRLDIYNLTNIDNEFEEDPISGADFRRTTAVQPPRAIRLGFQFAF